MARLQTKKQAAVTTGSAELRHSPRDGFHAYLALSPVSGLLATVAVRIIVTRRLDASIGAPGPRDFTSATCRSPARCESTLRQDRGHRIPSSTFVTIAKRPSHEDGTRRVFLIFGIKASKISLASAVEVIPLTSQRFMTFTRSCADHRAATRRRTPSGRTSVPSDHPRLNLQRVNRPE